MMSSTPPVRVADLNVRRKPVMLIVILTISVHGGICVVVSSFVVSRLRSKFAYMGLALDVGLPLEVGVGGGDRGVGACDHFLILRLHGLHLKCMQSDG